MRADFVNGFYNEFLINTRKPEVGDVENGLGAKIFKKLLEKIEGKGIMVTTVIVLQQLP